MLAGLALEGGFERPDVAGLAPCVERFSLHPVEARRLLLDHLVAGLAVSLAVTGEYRFPILVHRANRAPEFGSDLSVGAVIG